MIKSFAEFLSKELYKYPVRYAPTTEGYLIKYRNGEEEAFVNVVPKINCTPETITDFNTFVDEVTEIIFEDNNLLFNTTFSRQFRKGRLMVINNKVGYAERGEIIIEYTYHFYANGEDVTEDMIGV